MDLDLSSESYPSRSFSALSFDAQLLERGTERQDLRVSPVSWKTIGDTVGSLMSLRRHTAKHIPEISKLSCPDRPNSAPPTSDNFNLGNNTQSQSRLWRRTSTKISSEVAFKDSICFQSRKKGYGIPDTDTVFSHYPNLHGKMNNNSVRCAKKRRNSDISDQAMNEQSDSKQAPKSFVNTTHDESMSRGKVICCCFLIFPLTVVVTLFLISSFHFKYCSSMIHFNQSTLVKDFERELFGQHIAATVIPDKLQLYFDSFQSKHFSKVNLSSHPGADACKPLTLSFHGSTGVGKTFVSRLIGQAFSNVPLKPLIIPLVFPHESQQQHEAETMSKWIEDNLSPCKVNIFIVDEMDKAPEGAVRGLSDAIQKLSSECSPWYPTVFLLLSNTHATKINLMFTQLLSKFERSVREDQNAAHFQAVFEHKNQWYDMFVDRKLLDAFIPFLPLEKKHAIQCIKRDLQAKGMPETKALIESILKELHFTKYNDMDFSTTGCKRIGDKIDFIYSGKDMGLSKEVVEEL